MNYYYLVLATIHRLSFPPAVRTYISLWHTQQQREMGWRQEDNGLSSRLHPNLFVSVVLCTDLFVSTIVILACPSPYSPQPRPCCIPLLPPPHPHCRLDTLALAQTLILLGAARCRACRVLLTVHCVPRGTTARGGRRWRWRQTSRRRQTSPAT